MGPLENIEDVKDIKHLSNQELEELAADIRAFMIDHVSRTGGHLAPSLGVVELTLVLHQIYDSPKDKIIWDVGHQSYCHKIITGRKCRFTSLRQYKGLSGFPKTFESEHDCFNTGHSSTSISAALGMAIARDLKGENHKVIAVIGDGALTGGMAFEALNHGGDLHTDLIVVLNDNEMSIAPNVGAMSGYLSRMRTDPRYERGKEELEQLLNKIPKVGPMVAKTVERFKDSLKYFVVSGMLFEDMGFTYLGPIDGHNIGAMKTVFTNANQLKGPVLVHVVTKKGKGYPPAEANPDIFHGVGPFDPATGKVFQKEGPPAYTKIFGETLMDLAEDQDNIVAITAAMPGGTGLDKFSKKYPKRFFDVGIAEQHAVTFSAGLAAQGFHPVVAIYASFLQRAYDQVLHDVAMQNLPVTFALDRAGLVGEDGETHHGIFDISMLRHMPRLVMMAPKDENELRGMLTWAVKYQGPTVLRYPRGAGQGVEITESYPVIQLGQGEVVLEGHDLTMIPVGPMVYTALQAAEQLKEQGISAAVLNPRFIKPLDHELIVEYAKKTKRIVTIEEHVLAGGFGSACLELLNQENSGAEILNIGLPDAFIEQGSPNQLRQAHDLTASAIAEGVLKKWTFPEKRKRPEIRGKA
ncbi:1-deoxy-D-xylulose-5-phosphate synthase [Dehalobacterium formicoaceticum]|uniref:1-deoxy-D-xylulose-5-phosphate synthase n=1 Tax=Dehalobacterium formicoaceticum TaxID=51515 RepID=A0ABT1Y6S3_9FIRM|nr:1-deoxy-D-xylulose-5-phosphate synthase [Dehalobacterium formicoaceticum]MCR6545800.1 1-deoxy-D-xylulose-5-phosphate synthase [Dehalobacterium formicoaceticum]